MIELDAEFSIVLLLRPGQPGRGVQQAAVQGQDGQPIAGLGAALGRGRLQIGPVGLRVGGQAVGGVEPQGQVEPGGRVIPGSGPFPQVPSPLQVSSVALEKGQAVHGPQVALVGGQLPPPGRVHGALQPEFRSQKGEHMPPVVGPGQELRHVDVAVGPAVLPRPVPELQGPAVVGEHGRPLLPRQPGQPLQQPVPPFLFQEPQTVVGRREILVGSVLKIGLGQPVGFLAVQAGDLPVEGHVAQGPAGAGHRRVPGGGQLEVFGRQLVVPLNPEPAVVALALVHTQVLRPVVVDAGQLVGRYGVGVGQAAEGKKAVDVPVTKAVHLGKVLGVLLLHPAFRSPDPGQVGAHLGEKGAEDLIDHVGQDAGGEEIGLAQGVRHPAQFPLQLPQEGGEVPLLHGVPGGAAHQAVLDHHPQPPQDLPPVPVAEVVGPVGLRHRIVGQVVDMLADVGRVAVQAVVEEVVHLPAQRLVRPLTAAQPTQRLHHGAGQQGRVGETQHPVIKHHLVGKDLPAPAGQMPLQDAQVRLSPLHGHPSPFSSFYHGLRPPYRWRKLFTIVKRRSGISSGAAQKI